VSLATAIDKTTDPGFANLALPAWIALQFRSGCAAEFRPSAQVETIDTAALPET
jgi:hypothetical protein